MEGKEKAKAEKAHRSMGCWYSQDVSHTWEVCNETKHNTG